MRVQAALGQLGQRIGAQGATRRRGSAQSAAALPKIRIAACPPASLEATASPRLTGSHATRITRQPPSQNEARGRSDKAAAAKRVAGWCRRLTTWLGLLLLAVGGCRAAAADTGQHEGAAESAHRGPGLDSAPVWHAVTGIANAGREGEPPLPHWGGGLQLPPAAQQAVPAFGRRGLTTLPLLWCCAPHNLPNWALAAAATERLSPTAEGRAGLCHAHPLAVRPPGVHPRCAGERPRVMSGEGALVLVPGRGEWVCGLASRGLPDVVAFMPVSRRVGC